MTRAIDAIARALYYVSMGLIFGVMLLVSADVVGRYVFNKPILGTIEITELALATIVFLGLGYTAVLRGHIAVDLAVSRLPARIRAVLDAINLLLGMAVFSLMAWQLTDSAIYATHVKRTTVTLYIPLYPFRFVAAVGVVVLCLVLITQVVRALSEAGKRREIPQATDLASLRPNEESGSKGEGRGS